ncbi:hypothetical protein PXC01_00600 [Maribacter sp. M208]|uniref:hypothetical protein n=1 Tax=Maribacter huludaoensis TaxID=3030010 RepID=UPI0023EC5E2F|nr:hypothetical protein [Maribacter huludaoensis]MDF4220064.1 hypothetical protein [Maribacter huludaoensis]
MKKLFLLITFLPFLALSQENNDCEERTMPYWANNINSRIRGENPTLRKAFKKIQLTETNIQPSNGFMTLKLYITKTGEFCEMETFQIDEDYQPTVFNNGTLIKELETVALSLTDWERDKDFKTYNLIKLKIKNGKIEEIF